MSWFKREDNESPVAVSGQPPENGSDAGERNVRTEGLWVKCPGCRQPIYRADLDTNLNVCPKCQYHFKIGARQRIELLLEPGFDVVDVGLRSTDPLNFTDIKPYKQRLRVAREQTGLDDAILNAIGSLGPHGVVLSAMEYSFIEERAGARALERELLKQAEQQALSAEEAIATLNDLIHLDIDPWEIGKNYPTEAAILGDPKSTLPELTALAGQAETRELFARAAAGPLTLAGLREILPATTAARLGPA